VLTNTCAGMTSVRAAWIRPREADPRRPGAKHRMASVARTGLQIPGARGHFGRQAAPGDPAKIRIGRRRDHPARTRKGSAMRRTERRVNHLHHQNGEPLDNRAERKCRCGGVQYDWGCGPCTLHLHDADRHPNGWVMNWYCVGRGGCGLMSVEHLSHERLGRLRQKTHGVGRRRPGRRSPENTNWRWPRSPGRSGRGDPRNAPDSLCRNAPDSL
jgi:hypothetical protein